MLRDKNFDSKETEKLQMEIPLFKDKFFKAGRAFVNLSLKRGISNSVNFAKSVWPMCG